MDDRWESEVVEYGAINITGFRIVDTSRKYVKDFLEAWKRLDKLKFPGAGELLFTVKFHLLDRVESRRLFNPLAFTYAELFGITELHYPRCFVKF